ncbi:hypothetical protein EK21DRAFT_112653 [Setomelanomma holmii]|uniref:Uncharacterized protein n=1 Tax=Setomelanomma holmii TaxID=210430 RepID=A0A9P4H938_9PLEO|nr:hypothetical protein EK21DRAFT_112653 [Setomelanomma holmii]
MTPTHQSLDDSSDLAFQTTATSIGIKHDGFLGEWMALYSKGISSDLSGMSHDMFFPTPAMTDPWGEAPTPNLSWNSAPDLPFLLDETMPPAEPDAAVAEAAPGRRELVSDREVPDTHGTVNTASSLPRGDSQLETPAFTGARLSHVLKAVAAAGFDSLDDAVVTYYAEALKDDERLRQEQRLSRIRRLPVLLKELHLAAQGWGQWQRRGFQEQIIKSTEDIVIAELKDHLATRRPDKYNSTCSTEQPGQSCRHKAKDETDVEAELPNTWTLLTSLFSKYDAITSKDEQTDVPKLVSQFLAAGTDSGARGAAFA